MNYPTSTEIQKQIHRMASSPANSKNERAFGLRDVRDCAVRLLDGETQDIEIDRLKDKLEAAEATIKAIVELHDMWLQQNKNLEMNMVAVEAGCGDAYDWRLRIRTRKQCVDELEALLNRSNDQDNDNE